MSNTAPAAWQFVRRRWPQIGTLLAFSILFVISACVAVQKEHPASALTVGDWAIDGNVTRLEAAEIGGLDNFTRTSIRTGPGRQIVRTWSPKIGVAPGSAVSPWFSYTRYITIPVVGQFHPPTGEVSLLLRCQSHDRTLAVADATSNTNLTEATFEIPSHWCNSFIRLEFVSKSSVWMAGAGVPHFIDRSSFWKSSWLGLFCYFVIGSSVLALIALGAASLTRMLWPQAPALPVGLAGIGFIGLVIFYLYALPARLPFSWLGVVIGPVLCGAAAIFDRAQLAESTRRLAPYAIVWIFGATAFFFLYMMASAGVGHWDANARFSPAIWSSDNELPWKLAEAMRQHIALDQVFSGNWSASDRPPLMAGLDLVVAEPFALLQAKNDGMHVQPLAYNTFAIALSALWLPVAFYVWREVMGLRAGRATLALIVLCLLPFTMFNTIFGWPKMLGGALALCSAATALTPRGSADGASPIGRASLFAALGGLGMMSHMSIGVFVAVAAIAYVVMCLWRRPSALAAAIVIGGGINAIWLVFQMLVMKSSGPLTKYAFAGTFGFENPGKGVFATIVDTYRSMGFRSWLDRKIEVVLSMFGPTKTYTLLTSGDTKPDFASQPLDLLRVYDFYYMSWGNLLLPMGASVGLVGLIIWRKNAAARSGSHLAMLGVASLLAAMATFMCQLFLVLLPYASLLALLVGGFGALLAAAPRVALGLGAASGLYGLAIWVVAPLRTAAHVDLGATAIFLAILGAACAFTVFRLRSETVSGSAVAPAPS